MEREMAQFSQEKRYGFSSPMHFSSPTLDRIPPSGEFFGQGVVLSGMSWIVVFLWEKFKPP